MLIPYKGIMPKVHPSVFITESARVIGDVEIGEFSSVWFNSVVRGDVHYIRIGERTNVQDNCTLHVTKDVYPLIIGSDITIGHNVTLHGCVVKDRCLIGMGAIALDDAEIGEDCIVGAGALVKEGMKVPPGSLVVGVPAKVVRRVTEEEKERIKQSALNYIEYAKDYTGR
ncbi:MAG: gamma carbonic anhydrase family protein [Deltaproteobacteria bacterium]|nr:gamma carbonic anhydrase family protein [Deltaproteobacteria bacterium]